LKRSFLGIDAFYKFNEENFKDFCNSPQRAEEVLKTKLKNLVDALRKTDNVATEMFEDLSRTPNVIPQPLPVTYQTYLETTKRTLLQEFLSRINAKQLEKPCPRPDSRGQLEINIKTRPTRPPSPRTTTIRTTTIRTTTTTTERVTTTTSASVNQFLLNAFNLRNG